MEPIHKLNGGDPITLCNTCRKIIARGFVDALQCTKCKLELIESLKKK